MKTIKAEILMIEGAPFPAIEKVYDPSSKKCNGRITPQAPIVITGHHLDMLTWDSANLYLVSSFLASIYTYVNRDILIK